MATYLIGDRGTARCVAYLGLTVTLIHTLGNFALGGVAIYLARYVLPEVLFSWLEVVSGSLVVLIGLSLLFSCSRTAFEVGSGKARHTRDHQHTSHGGHTHLPPGVDGTKVGIRGLIALGLSGGPVPCPAALVLPLSALSLGRPGFAMVLVVYSVGLAIVLTGIGLLMIYARKLFEPYPFGARVPCLSPVVSTSIITLIGAGIALGALAQTGIV